MNGSVAGPNLTGLLNLAVEAPGQEQPANRLISPAARARLQEVTDRLPLALSARLGFEARLNPDDDRLDGHLPLAAGRAALELQNLLNRPGTPPEWTGLGGAMDRWLAAAPGSALSRVPELWLGFDLDPAQRRPTPPRLFFSLPPASGAFDISGPDYAWLRSFIDPNGELGQTWPTWAEAARISRSLPLGCRPLIGFTPGRPEAGLKLCGAEKGPEEAGRFLNRLSGLMETGAAQTALADYGPLSGRVDVSMDVRDRIQPRLGLEIYPRPLAGRPGLGDWGALFRRLNKVCLAAGDKLAELKKFDRVFLARPAGLLWPMVVLRRVSHLKLDCGPENINRVKAYFILTARPAGDYNNFSEKG